MKAHLTPKVVPVEIPIGEGHDFHGIINLFSGHCHFYKKGTKTGEYDVVPIPDEYQARFQEYTEQLTEAVASTDDTLIERYLGGEEIPRAEFIGGVKKAMLAGADRAALLRQRRADLRRPHPAQEDGRAASRRRRRRSRRSDAALVGRVFKTLSEPHVGDVTLFRLYTGELRNGDEVWNAEHEVAEKLNHLSIQQGKERIEVERLSAGDIGSVAKLRDTHTGDTFCQRDHPVRLPPIPFPDSVATSAVLVKQRGEEDKLAAGLHKLHEEDPTFHFEYSSELGQTLIHGMGERHFDTILNRLERKFGVHAELARPRVAYRETIKGKAEGQGKHKKQSGGRGQYGDCWIRVAPLPRGAGYEFVDEIVGGVIPNKYIPAVDRGVQEAAVRGVIAGLSAGRLQGRVLRRLLPRRGLERNVVQDGRHSGVQERRPEGPAGAAGAAGGRGGLGAGRRAGRRDGRSQLPPRPDPGHRARRPAHPGPGDRARGGALQVLHHAPLDHPRPGHPPEQVPRVRRGAAGGRRQGGGGEPAGARRGVVIALTREVSPTINACELTHLAREPIDVERAAEQHGCYEALLGELGCDVRRIAPAPELPDAVFVEDTAIVLDEIAVITRPGAESRRPETAAVAIALAVHRRVVSIVAPGTLDGGDVLRTGRTLYVGISGRSNPEGPRPSSPG